MIPVMLQATRNRLKERIALIETSPTTEIRGVTCHGIIVLPATRDPTQVNVRALTPASKLVLDLPTPVPRGMEG